MNSFLNLTATLLAFVFRVITSPLLLVLYCISGLVLAIIFIHKWTSEFSTSRHFKIGKIVFPYQVKKYLQLSRH